MNDFFKDRDLTIKVNGTFIPTPVDIDYGLEDLDADSSRDVTTGKLDRNRIRKDVVKLNLVYGIDKLSDISLLLNTISGENFTVEYFDLIENGRIEKVMYAGPKSFRVIKAGGVWIKGFKVNFTEV